MKPVTLSESQPVQSLGRVLDVLELFSAERSEHSLSEIAQLLEWPVATAHRATVTLLEREFLARDPRTKRFRLGSGVVRLVAPLLAGFELPRLARARLRTLAGETGETVSLAILDGADALYLASCPGSFRLRVEAATPGLRLPAHCTALGKCLLAQVEPEEARRRLGPEPYLARTEVSIRSWADLAQTLASARVEGYALSIGEYETGLLSCAVPLATPDGVAAAINVAAPATRTTPEALVDVVVPKLRATVDAIERDQAGAA